MGTNTSQAPPESGDGFRVGTPEAVRAQKQDADILSASLTGSNGSRGIHLILPAANDGPDAVESYPKRLARLRAQFALAGFELHPLQGDSLLVARWGMHRVLSGLAEAERMLVRIGGVRG